jgi:hypothetical protein
MEWDDLSGSFDYAPQMHNGDKARWRYAQDDRGLKADVMETVSRVTPLHCKRFTGVHANLRFVTLRT